ncbi:MAG: hypothetical protein ACYCSN_19840 [Acidobacteriaceae bacterium]
MRKKRDAKEPKPLEDVVTEAFAESLGVPIGDVPDAVRLLHGVARTEALATIPLMDPVDPRPFIASVAALVGSGALSPDKAKVMLYACQLQVAVTRGLQAEAQPRVAPRQLAASADTGSLWAVNSTNGFDPEGRA